MIFFPYPRNLYSSSKLRTVSSNKLPDARVQIVVKMADPISASTVPSVPQVRIQLSSPDQDILLPENIGSILVNTSKMSYISLTMIPYIHCSCRSPPLRSFYARQRSFGK